MTTKAEVFAWAEARGVAISQELGAGGAHHVHADIEAPRTCFRAHGLHNLGVWDDVTAPRWPVVMRELLAADIGPCEIEDCEVCGGD